MSNPNNKDVIEEGADQTGDQTLGLRDNICRRDFLNAILLGSGSILLGPLSPAHLLAQRAPDGSEWDGPGGVGDYSVAHGNPWSVMNSAHAIRDGLYDKPPLNAINTGEVFDCVIVGGGISGLAAALFISRDTLGAKKRRCLVLENHPVFGGAARRNEFDVDGQRLMAPQGPAQFPIPFQDGLIDRFYREVGFNYSEFQYQSWGGPSPEMPLSRTVVYAGSCETLHLGNLFWRKIWPEAGAVVG